MWIAKLRIKHDDCVVGTRCKKYNVSSIGVPIDSYNTKTHSYFLHFETLQGKDEDIKAFIDDLKKDKKIKELEVEGTSLFFLVEIPIKNKIPTTHYNPKTFFLKPVVVDTDGYEYWEIGSWKKGLLNDFILNLQKENFDVKILKLQDSKLTNIYFPQVMPFLSKNQRKALELAFANGYYDYPRKIELKNLAMLMKLSLSTYREHLRRAEKKVMPDLIRNVKDEIPR